MTDDAHGIGVVGGGRGSTFAAGQQGRCAAADGHAVEGDRRLWRLSLRLARPSIELIHNRARSFVYSTGLPPAIAAAAIAALDLIERDPAYAALPLAKARAFTRRVGLPEAESPIVPLIVGDAQAALQASRLLEAEGFLVIAIRPPTVPAGTARLRFAFTAQHPDAEIERLADVVRARVLTRPGGTPSRSGAVAAHDRDLRHRDRNRCRQDLRHRRADPAFPRRRPRGRCASSRW